MSQWNGALAKNNEKLWALLHSHYSISPLTLSISHMEKPITPRRIALSLGRVKLVKNETIHSYEVKGVVEEQLEEL